MQDIRYLDTLPLFPLVSHFAYSLSFSLFKCIFSSPCDYLVSFLLAAACYYVILVIRPPAVFTFAFVRSSCFPQLALLSSFPLPLSLLRFPLPLRPPLSSLSRVLMVLTRMRTGIDSRRETLALCSNYWWLLQSLSLLSLCQVTHCRLFSFLFSSAFSQSTRCKLLRRIFTRLFVLTKVNFTQQL